MGKMVYYLLIINTKAKAHISGPNLVSYGSKQPPMKLHDYNKLHKEQQLLLLWEHGFVIGERQKERYSFILYSTWSFYVELKYYGTILHGYQVYGDKKELDFSTDIIIPKDRYRLSDRHDHPALKS